MVMFLLLLLSNRIFTRDGHDSCGQVEWWWIISCPTSKCSFLFRIKSYIWLNRRHALMSLKFPGTPTSDCSTEYLRSFFFSYAFPIFFIPLWFGECNASMVFFLHFFNEHGMRHRFLKNITVPSWKSRIWERIDWSLFFHKRKSQSLFNLTHPQQPFFVERQRWLLYFFSLMVEEGI